jgi:hypothetical protein
MSMGRVAVVWGDNRDLARAVGSELARFGFEPHVGGDERGPGSWYDRVTRGFKADSWAIVLMQWPSDSHLRSEEHVSKTEQEWAREKKEHHVADFFRPNVMFELGFLECWLSKEDRVRRFLIGAIDHRDVPTDIEGLPCDHVPLFDAKGRPFSRPELARRIVESFITSMRPNWPTALGAFVDWAAWKSWIRRQLDSIVPPDDLRLALSLLHSIQPAFYAGELPDLLAQVDRIKASRDGRAPSENRAVTPELTAACNVVKAACCYYRLQAQDTPPPLNDYFDIAESLKHAQRGARLKSPRANAQSSAHKRTSSDHAHSVRLWIDVVRFDFLGLVWIVCEQKSVRQSRNYLAKSIDALKESLRLLDRLKEFADDESVVLWKGYVKRNLGAALSARGQDYREANRLLNEAKDHRRAIYDDYFDSERLGKFKEYAWLEVQLVSLEMLQRQRRLKPEFEEKYVATVGRIESRLPRPKLPAEMRGLILHLIAIGSQNNSETVRRVSSSFEERVSKYAEYEDESWSYV